LDWREQFGYELAPQSRNLNALRDGFDFGIAPGGGVVLVLRSFPAAWREDANWSRGFLEIATEHSLRELALGQRFFTVVVVPDVKDALIGQPLEGLRIPEPFAGNFR
jgi:hypothetical protein